ncbi:MAG: HAD hydrolase family protein [Pseudonocardiaceae bacterium]
MAFEGSLLSGRVSRYFNETDKLKFVQRWCAANGYHLGEVAAVGDSRSDVPLFQKVGMAIALNATTDARGTADMTIDTSDLADILPILLDGVRGGRSGSDGRVEVTPIDQAGGNSARPR